MTTSGVARTKELADLLGILEGFSFLRVVPYASSASGHVKKTLDAVLSGVPYFFMDNGNVLIGAASPEEIRNGGLCLQAHLDHPGGLARVDAGKKYLAASLEGFSRAGNLVGHKFGIFSAHDMRELAQLDVEHVHADRSGAFAYFLPPAGFSEQRDGEDVIVCHPSGPQCEDGVVSSWNLDDALNCSEIIRQVKKHRGRLYALLSVDEESGHKGMNFYLTSLGQKDLFILNMDVVSGTLKLDGGAPAFGFRSSQAGVRLDKHIPESVRKAMTGYAFAEIPAGKCEAVTALERGARAAALFVAIENFHNGNGKKRFLPERIKEGTLAEYLRFTDKAVEAFLSDMPRPSVAASDVDGRVVRTDFAKEIADTFLKAKDFPDYLNNGLPPLAKVFSGLGIAVPAMSAEAFEQYRAKSNIGAILSKIEKTDINALKDAALSCLREMFPGYAIGAEQDVEIITLLFGQFNACNVSNPKKAILLSLDKIAEGDLERILVHEISHYFTDALFWRESRLSAREGRYFGEGAAIVASARVLGIPLEAAIGITEERLADFTLRKDQLRAWMNLYMGGDFVKLYEGKWHRYFVKNEVPDPFMANMSADSRYGYYLAGIDSEELSKKGVFYEKILRKPIP